MVTFPSSKIETRLGSPVWIAEEERGRPLGIIRFAIGSGKATASVTIAPDARGNGLAAPVVAAGTRKLLAKNSALLVQAFIRPGNTPSERAFSLAGYVPAGRDVENGVELLRYVVPEEPSS